MTTEDEDPEEADKPSMLLPLKRKRDGDIEGPEIYSIFINQFIDIFANSPKEETIRHYHSLFHVNKSTQKALLRSSSLTSKREQFEFAKCLEGLIPHCQITIHCPRTQNTYLFRFEPPSGVILHFRSKYCKMIAPEDMSVVFNRMMLVNHPREDDPLCSIQDFRRIWQLLKEKVRKWPDTFLVHEKHMGTSFNRNANEESNNTYTRMGYTDLSDPTPVTPSRAMLIHESLARVESWRKREETRSSTRLSEIEEARNVKKGYVENENASVERESDKAGKNKKPGKLRRSARLLGKKQSDILHYI